MQNSRHNAYVRLTILAIGLLVLSRPEAAAEDWKQFLGPDAQSTVESTKLPGHWSESENIKWHAETEGLGWSSPVISGDRIYFTSAIPDGDELQLTLVCHDLETGKPLFTRGIFRQAAGSPGIHSKNSHASPTPLVAGEDVFVHFGHQGTACVDLDGNVRWSTRDHGYAPVHGNGSSPILVDGLLILTCDGADDPFTLALAADTGKEVWRTSRGVDARKKFSFCTPTLIHVGNQEQVISVGSEIVQSLNPKSGQVIWSARFEGYSVIPRPLYHQGLVFISTGYDSPQVIAIDPTGRGDVTDSHIRWTHSRGAPNTPSMISYGDAIVMVSDGGVACALDAATGSELWKKRLGGNYSATPLRVGSLAYFQSEDGESIILDLASDSEPKEVARNKLPGRIFASYAVAENDLIIRAEKGLYRISNK